MAMSMSKEKWWTVQQGPGPIVATAIHDGHDLRFEVAEAMKLPDLDRLREEDPFTGQAIVDIPNHVIAHRSRFEFDLNRGGDSAVYSTPEQAWGLDIWHQPPERNLIDRSLEIHSAYYRMLGAMLDGIAADHERFVVIDVHSYNHRRDGADGAPTDPAKAPDINIGTFSMPRDEWAFLMNPLIEAMRGFDFNGRQLDVRENIAFQGKGEQTRFIHDRYPGQGCAIALEFKKFFMDEWSGQPDPLELDAMRRLITFTAETCERLLR
ncbi:MAG: N-formylglutamate amidohydrolase [Sphingomonas sp.]|nr:N-formylglutamate amidohydrolase [Sphingomonas sp.]